MEVDVVLTKKGSDGHCLVVAEGYQGYHVHRFGRVAPGGPGKGKNFAKEYPLHRISRGKTGNGIDSFKAPSLKDSKEHWENLSVFLENVDRMALRLKPLLQKVQRDNSVVVMVANAGVIELLANFVCAANSRKLDISTVIVFATDKETFDVALGLGLSAFFDEEGGFGITPKEEARGYGDKTFTNLMYKKVLSVYLPMYLGYNVLFQDVDIIWNADPLPYFHGEVVKKEESEGDHDEDLYDAYFMDDGARSLRYAPYSANSGFYFLRNNDRTMYMMTTLMYIGDSIIHTHSHQQTLSTLLTEFNSLYGMSVKTLSQDEFPGGKAYHHNKPYMKKWMEGEFEPIIFHMCWTLNKDDKLSYLQQLGGWYLNAQCTGDSMRANSGDPSKALGCCSAEPVITCHFKDKPSIVKCDDSPDRDKGGGKFLK